MIKVSSGDQLKGRVVLPASKSISNRALLINALSRSELLPENLSDSDDTRVMLRALQTLSVSPLKGEKSGNASLPLREDRGGSTLDIGAAGTAMRFLTAYLSVTPGEHTITGTERMKHRPIGILVEALRQLGATISYEGEEGFPPLHIVGRDNLEGGALTVPGDVSSQYISALLMIAPTLKNGLHLTLTGTIASRPYLEMTIAMMRDFGAKVEWQGDNVIDIQPGPYLHRTFRIESDWSAASYWYEMVALTRDEAPCVTLPGLFRESLQGDSAVQEMFRPLGVETTFVRQDDGSETVQLSRSGKPCKHLELNLMGQPDLAQTLIVCCAMLGTTFRFSGLASLKIKETNRTAALQTELRKLGIVLHEDGNSIVYWDGERCDAEEEPAIDTYEDHRMAMAFAPICLRTGGQIQINNPQVVSKSYPAFWDDLSKIGFKICR